MDDNDELVQMKIAQSECDSTRSIGPPIVNEVLNSPGQPLDMETRIFFEPRFEHDFSKVRVHADTAAAESARAVNALAFTVGKDIIFGEGQYSPRMKEGSRLVAHELAHVIQQHGSSPNLRARRSDSELRSFREREGISEGQKIFFRNSVVINKETNANRIQRRAIVEQPAAGCGLCYGPRMAGSVAHRLIQEEFEILYPLGLVEIPISSPVDENARLDIAVATPTGLQIGEIKPANASGYAQGADDMAFYLTAVQSMFPSQSVRPLTLPLPPSITIFPNPQVPSCPLQELFVNPPIGGVYGYFCRPSYGQLVGNPNCRCAPKIPPPVPVRQEALEKIRDFLRRVVTSGEEAEAAARGFLRENPEVKYLLVGAAIAIIVATIAEDIATLGAGLLDDPASLAAAYALVRVAQSAP